MRVVTRAERRIRRSTVAIREKRGDAWVRMWVVHCRRPGRGVRNNRIGGFDGEGAIVRRCTGDELSFLLCAGRRVRASTGVDQVVGGVTDTTGGDRSVAGRAGAADQSRCRPAPGGERPVGSGAVGSGAVGSGPVGSGSVGADAGPDAGGVRPRRVSRRLQEAALPAATSRWRTAGGTPAGVTRERIRARAGPRKAHHAGRSARTGGGRRGCGCQRGRDGARRRACDGGRRRRTRCRTTRGPRGRRSPASRIGMLC